jgi:hypothetical protein
MRKGNPVRIVKTIALIFWLSGALYAQAPELRNVMPNSWKKLTKLPVVEEAEFLKENSSLVRLLFKEFHMDSGYVTKKGPGGYIESVRLEYPVMYRQRVGLDEFYRILFSPEVKPDFMSEDIMFAQALIYRNKAGRNMLLIACRYNDVHPTQNGDCLTDYKGIDLVAGSDGAKSIIISQVLTVRNGYFQPLLRKGQILGSTEVIIFQMDKIRDKANGEFWSSPNGDLIPAGVEYDRIFGSDCLVDVKSPLRYGLQSAFDGDPATSYVENTEDDLMKIEVFPRIRKMAIINGFAQTPALYDANNRIKTVKTYYKTDGILLDNCLAYQFIDTNNSGGLYVIDIFKGSKYNDTCLAELNIKTDDGWLFGDIEE